jgi:LysM repeat protein
MTIDAVARIPTFVRKFSWDHATPPSNGGTSNQTSATEPNATTGQTTDTPTNDSGAVTAVTYLVQQGETLWGIAKKFGTTVSLLADANHIADPSKIRAGQKLTIPR